MEKDVQLAAGLLNYLQEEYIEIKLYTTGNCHRVFSVTQKDRKVVLRITDRENGPYYEGSLVWLPKLRDMGIPVPSILRNGSFEEYFYTVITHLPGVDLGEAYPDLDNDEKRSIAQSIAHIQKMVSTLPESKYYGYSQGKHEESWKDVVVGLLLRAEERFQRNKIFPMKYIELTGKLLEKFDDYLLAIPKTPFLDDTTTKNVLVYEGRLSGIVDVDEVCYGDPLMTVGLTNMALLNSGFDTRYVDYWMDALELTEEQRQAVTLYTLVYCVDFVGKQGISFGNGKVERVEKAKIDRLTEIFHIHCKMLSYRKKLLSL